MNPSGLAPWAAHPERSRGRRFAEPPSPSRNEHQRDRDRIVHCTAFRRLVYKTQVFVNHEGDHFRTRLTHSLEVAQVARSAARALRLNEDLVEAIALAHDLGHTPFGHAGQDALHECLAAHGGFEHNLQSLRVVDRLEQRYFGFDGLNLTFETREGILKHCSRRNAERLVAAEPRHPAKRFLAARQAGLEAQVVNLADEIAYSTHDLDDGLRSGLLTLAQVQELALVQRCHRAALEERAHAASPAAGERRLVFETLRRLLSQLIEDLVRSTAAAVAAAQPEDIDAVRAAPALAGFSSEVQTPLLELKRFLFHALYRHEQVVETTTRARQVVHELFKAYLELPAEMPPERTGSDDPPRAVADYIAGMTDRFALREHQRLTGARLL